jgi:signal transduction histidine kinase
MDEQTMFRLKPGKIVGIYLSFGFMWILVTEWVLPTRFGIGEMGLFSDSVAMWGFVGLSSALVFVLTYVRQRQVQDSREVLRAATEQLQVLHRVFRHNLRNDLTVILGQIELLQQKIPDEKDHHTQLDLASQTAEHIKGISDKVSVINDVDSDPPVSQEVDLATLTDDEITRIQDEYPELTISATLPESMRIIGDPTVRYAVREALENAAEHNTKSVDKQEISVQVNRRYGGVILEIADNGPTIPQHELAVLRQREETDLSHSSGIGLWLITWLSQYNGGNVVFDTESGQGTTVTFQFKVGTDISLYQSSSVDGPNPAVDSPA